MTPSSGRLYDAVEATWPAADRREIDGWAIRTGKGGGKRVSAATATGPVTPDMIAHAEAAMKTLGQDPIFMVRDGEAELDRMLEARGYRIIDPVALYVGEAAHMAEPAPPPVSVFPCWPPLGIQKLIWAEAGIGPGRLSVMKRVTCPKTALLGRVGDRAAGCGFVAADHDIAMIHALEVAPNLRRRGAARYMMRGAAIWALHQGCRWLGLVVTEGNSSARALYASLDMQLVGHYHYRCK